MIRLPMIFFGNIRLIEWINMNRLISPREAGGGKEGKEEPRNIAFHNILLCRTVSQLETFSSYSRQKGLCLSPPGHFLSCTTNNRIIPKFNQTFFYEKSIQILKFKSCPSNRFQINLFFFLDKFEKTFAHSS